MYFSIFCGPHGPSCQQKTFLALKGEPEKHREKEEGHCSKYSVCWIVTVSGKVQRRSLVFSKCCWCQFFFSYSLGIIINVKKPRLLGPCHYLAPLSHHIFSEKKSQIYSFCCLKIAAKNIFYQHILLKPVFPSINQIHWLIYSQEYAVILQNRKVKLYCELVILKNENSCWYCVKNYN